MILNLASLKALVQNTEAIQILKTYPTSTVAGSPADTFTTGGMPVAGAVGAAGAGTAYDINSVGAPTLPAQGVGQELRLIGMNISQSMLGGIVLVDRLVATSTIDLSTTTPQAINTVALPSRAGAGAGVEAFLYTANGQASSVPTGLVVSISYTNQNGVAGKVGTLVSINGTVRGLVMQKFALEPGDSVQSIQSITAGTAGAVGVVWGVMLIKRICSVPTNYVVPKQAIGGAALGFPKIEPDACLALWAIGNLGLAGLNVDLQIASVPV